MTGGDSDLVVAGPSDAAALAAVHAAAFDPGWPEAEIEALLRLDTVRGLILHVAGLAHGFILVSQVADEAEILTLAVRRDHWRRGLGQRLLAAAVRLAAIGGGARIVLEVSEANRAARALYGAAGFSAVGRRRGYYKGACGPEDALVLELRLLAGADKAGE